MTSIRPFLPALFYSSVILAFLLSGILNFGRYLHLALIQRRTPHVHKNVHRAVLVRGSCVQGHLMEKG